MKRNFGFSAPVDVPDRTGPVLAAIVLLVYAATGLSVGVAIGVIIGVIL